MIIDDRKKGMLREMTSWMVGVEGFPDRFVTEVLGSEWYILTSDDCLRAISVRGEVECCRRKAGTTY